MFDLATPNWLIAVRDGQRARIVPDSNPYRRASRDQGRDGLIGPFGLAEAIRSAAAINVAADLD
jgi:hypothetical protein